MTSRDDLRGSGVADPDTLYWTRFSTKPSVRARQLVDDRWVWLPTPLAGRVFTTGSAQKR